MVENPPREHVGLLLRKAREKAGQQVRDVSDALNIRYVYIEALEKGEYGSLPGKAYATGFLRTYAQYLGLDVGEILRRFKEEESGPDVEAQLVFPTPVPEGKVPGAALIVVSVLFLGLVAYGARFYFAEEESGVTELVPPVPERLQNLVEDEAPLGRPDQTAERSTTTVVTSPVFVLPRPGEEDGSTEVEPIESVASMPAPTEPDPAPEPEVGTASTLGSGDQVDLPAAASPAQPAAPQQEDEPEPAAEPAASEAGQESQPVAAAAQAEAPEPVAADPPAEEARSGAAEDAEPAPPTIPTEPVVEPGLTTTAGSSQPVDLVAAIAEPPRPATRPADLPRTPAAAPEPATEAVTETAAIPAAPTTEGPAAPTEVPKPQVYGEGNLGARIVLRATQDSWVQVRDNEDSLLLTRLLRAGDTYLVPNRAGLTMLTGNAGGLEVEVDGTSLGPLGPVGKVRRDVSLDAERLIKAHNLAQ